MFYPVLRIRSELVSEPPGRCTYIPLDPRLFRGCNEHDAVEPAAPALIATVLCLEDQRRLDHHHCERVFSEDLFSKLSLSCDHRRMDDGIQLLDPSAV